MGPVAPSWLSGRSGLCKSSLFRERSSRRSLYSLREWPLLVSISMEFVGCRVRRRELGDVRGETSEEIKEKTGVEEKTSKTKTSKRRRQRPRHQGEDVKETMEKRRCQKKMEERKMKEIGGKEKRLNCAGCKNCVPPFQDHIC